VIFLLLVPVALVAVVVRTQAERQGMVAREEVVDMT
jgi:hypothetical protein